MQAGRGPLSGISRIRKNVRTKRASSWDRTGGNKDYATVPAGATLVLADLQGPACITHIWLTLSAAQDPGHLRNVVLKMFWDDESDPSVLSPVGDFFGCCHGVYRNFVSLPLAAAPQDGRSLNSYFPMPFAKRGRVEILNESPTDIGIYYYIDYEIHAAWDVEQGYFHAHWQRENLTEGDGSLEGVNLDGQGNYLILDAQGQGHYVGCMLGVDSRSPFWYGEGDDMIFIDGEPFPPSLHGTGTEDYFCTAWCPREEYNAPYFGAIMVSNTEAGRQPWEKSAWGTNSWLGKYSMYRFHIEDPIVFHKSIRVSIEHGHANGLANDYTSVAYWYQSEPHRAFAALPVPAERQPLRCVSFNQIHEWKKAYDQLQQKKQERS